MHPVLTRRHSGKGTQVLSGGDGAFPPAEQDDNDRDLIISPEYTPSRSSPSPTNRTTSTHTTNTAKRQILAVCSLILLLGITLLYSLDVHGMAQVKVASLLNKRGNKFKSIPVISVTHLESLELENEEEQHKYEETQPRRHPHRKNDADRVLQVLKDKERAAVVNLVLDEDATHTSSQTGLWDDPQTWSDSKVPDANCRIIIQANHNVMVSKKHDDVTFDWIRVDGTLTFNSNQQKQHMGLKFITMVVTDDGLLEIGASSDERLHPNISATLTIADRGPRDRENDPFDFKGAIIVIGKLNFFGAAKQSHSIPRDAITTGTKKIVFENEPHGWNVHDRLLFPGVNASPYEIQDEIRHIVSVSEDGQTIHLDEPLQFDHLSPSAESKHLVPVANLCRNILITSELVEPISKRGHFVILHRQTDVNIDGARFFELGRTNGQHAHTDPMAEKGTDHNTIGRYPLHFHVRGVSTSEILPMTVRNTVIEGGPKYGLVNHGAHLQIEDNVSYRVRGSHFFFENGSELGSVHGNLAVRSHGSDECIKSRMYIFDFGHGGHGFWMTGGGVDLRGNYAFGHHQGAFIYHTLGVREAVRTVYVRAKEAKNIHDHTDLPEWLHTDSVPLLFSNNVAASSQQGVEVWYHNRFSPHDAYSILEDSVFWNLRQQAPPSIRELTIDGSVLLPYSKNLILRNIRLYGNKEELGRKGVWANDETSSIICENLTVIDFEVGVYVPRGGGNVVKDCTFRCHKSIYIQNPTLPKRTIDLQGNHFENFHHPKLEKKQAHKIYLEEKNTMKLPPENAGDWSIKFESDQITYNEQQVYFQSQARNANLGTTTGLLIFRDISAGELWDNFGMAVSGVIAPSTAHLNDDVPNGLIGPRVSIPSQHVLQLASERLNCGSSMDYKPVLRTKDGTLYHSQGDVMLEHGWNLLDISTQDFDQTILVYSDVDLPTFEFKSDQSYMIHPSDVSFGFLVAGDIFSKVGPSLDRTKYRQIAKLPGIDPTRKFEQNLLDLSFEITGKNGCKAQVPLSVELTNEATRRGGNVNLFDQKSILNYAKEE
jgi:hypothetical protein